MVRQSLSDKFTSINLFGLMPPTTVQLDGRFGITAGICEVTVWVTVWVNGETKTVQSPGMSG